MNNKLSLLEHISEAEFEDNLGGQWKGQQCKNLEFNQSSKL